MLEQILRKKLAQIKALPLTPISEIVIARMEKHLAESY